MSTSHLVKSDLLSCPENPCPAGARCAAVETIDGVRLRTAAWRPAGTVRGTVLILQGRAEFVEKYFETVGELLARGFAVVAFDWRGQGGSGRRVADPSKGHVGDFSEYRLDLDAVGLYLARTGMPEPVIGLAHSMGGAVALTAAHAGWLPAGALVALAPMIDLKIVRYPRLVRACVRMLDGMGFSTRFVPGGDGRSISTLEFRGNRLSADPGRYARNAAVAHRLGPVAIGAPTVGWLAAAYRTMRTLQGDGLAAAIELPVCLIGAGEDPVCLTGAAEIFAGGLAGGSEALVIPGARHELLMETDAVRHLAWRRIDAFMGEHAPAPARRGAPQLSA